MSATFESLSAGDTIDGPAFAVSRESIRLFCDASLDYNPLHLDDDYMNGSFGKTNFGGIIMHGMNNFGLITRMLTDWAYPAGAIHRRLETRWVKPVRPGDTRQGRYSTSSSDTERTLRLFTIRGSFVSQKAPSAEAERANREVTRFSLGALLALVSTPV
jgi:3-hydroxybutyryl-CoA dehydratase